MGKKSHYEEQQARKVHNPDAGTPKPIGWDNWSAADKAAYWQSLPEETRRAYQNKYGYDGSWINEAQQVSDQRTKNTAVKQSAVNAAAAQKVTGAAADSQAQVNAAAIQAANSGANTVGGLKKTANGMWIPTGLPMAFAPKQDGHTVAPEGIDQTNKGVGEQLWGIKEKDFFSPGRAEQYADDTAGVWGKMGEGEKRASAVSEELAQGGSGQKYWEGVQGKYNAGGPGYVSDAYKSFDAAVDPNLGSYYDNAFDHAAGGINKQLAARGQYGSSTGMQQIGMAATDLNAARANREAAYGLERYRTKMAGAQAASGDELGWTKGLGDIAFAAGDERKGYLNDSAAQAASAQQMGQERTQAGFAQNAAVDQYNANNRNAGFDAAFAAQAARDNRIQQGFDNQIGFAGVLAGMGGNRIAGNYDAATTEAGAGQAAANDAYSGSQASADRQYQEYLSAQQSAAQAAASFAPKKVITPKGGK